MAATPSKKKPQAQVTRIKCFPSPSVVKGSVALCFTPDSGRLIVAGSDSVVCVFDVSRAKSNQVDLVTSFTQHQKPLHDATEQHPSRSERSIELVCSLSVSADGQWLATGDYGNQIHVYNLDALKVCLLVLFFFFFFFFFFSL
jgi:U3 small nucleolar RNA-associated protein 4